MPKLNIPEKIDIATEDCDCGESVMISDCIATLNAVADNPHKAQIIIVAGTLKETGHSSKTPAISPTIEMLMNRKRVLG